MKLAFALLLAVLATLAALSEPGRAAAQQPIEATVEVIGGADAPLTVGDPIVIRVEVRHPDDAWVEIDSSMTTLSPLDAALQELELSEPGRTVVTWRTAAFTVGVFDITLPPITVVSGGTRQLLSFEPQRIVIASVLTEDIIGPRPLTPPGVIEGGANFAPWIGCTGRDRCRLRARPRAARAHPAATRSAARGSARAAVSGRRFLMSATTPTPKTSAAASRSPSANTSPRNMESRPAA